MILPALASLRDVEVVAICGGSDAAKTCRLARRYLVPTWDRPFETVCRDGGFDLAFIASPHEHHAAMIRAALKAGVHMVCEKPLALRDADVVKLADRARRSGKLCLVDHSLRFHPAIRAARDAIRSGRIGRCVHMVAEYRTTRYADPGTAKSTWWFDPDRGGGMLHAMGTHLVDLARFCLDREPTSVRACATDSVIRAAVTPNGGRIPVKAESMFAALMDFGAGLSEVLQATGVSFADASGLTVLFRGDKGELRFESPGWLTMLDARSMGGPARTLRAPGAVDVNAFETAFRIFARELIRSLASGRARPLADACSFGEHVASHRAVSAMRQSAGRYQARAMRRSL